MGSICLSSASILRCTSLTRIQSIILFIPTALEVIFSILLIFVNWGNGRRHLLITAEGCVYAALALVDLLSHILPAAQKDLNIFRALDRFLGVASFLPIFFYTFFLYLFTQAELLETLPSRLRKFATLFLVLFIPVIVTINEVSSFIGIAYRMTPTPEDSSNHMNIGFIDSRQETLWTFFSSVTLALLAGYQTTASFFTFLRLVHAILNKKRIETSYMDAAHLLRGLPWLSAALKLGSIETVVGFAGGQFGVAFTRRMLRFLSRACLCIGLVKGVDTVIDFRAVEFEIKPTGGHKKEFRRSRLRQFISNPRLSTFRQLSPTATAFHSAPRGADNFYTGVGPPGMSQSSGMQKPQRVTIHYANGTPVLQVRFSALNLPTGFADKSKSSFSSTLSRPKSAVTYPFAYTARNSHGVKSSISTDAESLSSFYAATAEIITAPQRTLSQKSARALIYQATGSSRGKSDEDKHAAHVSTTFSVKSVPESIGAVRELTDQFPGPPSLSQDQQQLPFPASSPSIKGQGRPATAPDPIWEETSIPSSRTSSVLIPRWFRKDDIDSSASADERFQRQSFVRDSKISKMGTQATPKFSEAGQGSRYTPPLVLHPINPFEGNVEASEKQDLNQEVDVDVNPVPVLGTGGLGRFTKRPSHMPSVPSSPDPDVPFGLTRQTGSSSTLSTRNVPTERGSVFRNSGAYGTPERGSMLLPPRADSDRSTEWAETSSSRSSPVFKKPTTIPWIRRTSRLPVASIPAVDGEQTPAEKRGSIDNPMISRPKQLEERRPPPRRADSRPNTNLKIPQKPPSRIKSISSAPKRSTPNPTHSKVHRSLRVEPIMIPPLVNAGMTEVIQGSLNSAGSGRGVLRDLEVLRMEEGSRQRSKSSNYF